MTTRNDMGVETLAARYLESELAEHTELVARTRQAVGEEFVRLVSACSDALRAAKAAGAVTVAFTGEGGGRLAGQVDRSIFIPSKTTARIQEMHLMLGHVLCALLEQEAE